jgi:uncharacterized protein with HEPN domain
MRKFFGNWTNKIFSKSCKSKLKKCSRSIEKIEHYVSGLKRSAFLKDDKTTDSVVRNLEIIGEAANRLPQNFRTEHSEIEWRAIICQSHRSRLF